MSLHLDVVGAALGSTCFFALATNLKHRSAGRTPDAQNLRPRQVGRFIAATLTDRAWLGGLLADAGGLTLQVYALHNGALSVVQPLMVSALLFSLALNHAFAGTRISRAELLWGLALVVAVAGFLLVSGAAQAEAGAMPAERGPAFAAGAIAVVVGATCVLLARRMSHGRGAALVGVAVGITYAVTASLIKATTNVLVQGPVALLTSWQVYVLVLAGGLGLLLGQLAFQAGPLRASLPATATVDPLVSVALGVAIYDERLRHGPTALVTEAAFLILLSAAVIALGRLEAGVEAEREGRPTDAAAHLIASDSQRRPPAHDQA